MCTRCPRAHGNHHNHHGIQCGSKSNTVFPCRCVVWYRTRGVFIHSCAPWCVCYRHLRSLLSSSGMLVCSTDSQYHGTAHLYMLHPTSTAVWSPVPGTLAGGVVYVPPRCWQLGDTRNMTASGFHVLCCCQISSPRLLLLTVTIQRAV